MAANVTVIGRAARIRGRVNGPGDIDVQGFVEGDVAVEGDVTVGPQGIVGAGIRGRRVVVRGAVKGDLLGDEAVLLEDGARVVGDVRAPRVAIAAGALVRGYVQAGEGGAAPQRTSRAQPAARPAASSSQSGQASADAQREKAPAATPPKTAAKPVAVPARASSPQASHAPSNSVPRRPPPPVVPVLKGAKGQIAKKRER